MDNNERLCQRCGLPLTGVATPHASTHKYNTDVCIRLLKEALARSEAEIVGLKAERQYILKNAAQLQDGLNKCKDMLGVMD